MGRSKSHQLADAAADEHATKVFCISMQRSRTTSVGKFFRDFGFGCVGWPADQKNGWSDAWYEKDYDRIFESSDFRSANAFEDSPWWLPGFYRVLFQRFPNSKFVLFTRNADEWFQSMKTHSGGSILSRSKVHVKIYQREVECFELMLSGRLDEALENQHRSEKTMRLEPHEDHPTWNSTGGIPSRCATSLVGILRSPYMSESSRIP